MNLPLIQSLLLQGANPVVHFEGRLTALHVAAMAGDLKIWTLLCESTGDVMCLDEHERTPLHLCVLYHHNSLLRHLLTLIKVTDIDHIDCEGNTALHYAAKLGDVGAIRLLLSHGASPLVSNVDGQTPATLCGDGPGSDLLRECLSPVLTKEISPLSSPKLCESAPVLPFFHMDLPISLDSFTPLGLLNSGQFGDTFLVQHNLTGQLYALKSVVKGRDKTSCIRPERHILGRLDHPFLVKLHWAFQTSSNLYLVVDYCPAGDLAELIRRETRLSEDAVRFFTAEIVLALEALHKENVVYRDLQPENIVLDTSGHIRLTDFSFAKALPTSSDLSFWGPSGYFPPEMILEQQSTKAVDWYMLGCLMYEMVVGQPPFETQDETKQFSDIEFPQDVSKAVRDIIRKLLRTDVKKRLGSGGVAEVKSHPFFAGLSWESVYAKRYSAPVATPRKKPMSLRGCYAFQCRSDRGGNHVQGWSFNQGK